MALISVSATLTQETTRSPRARRSREHGGADAQDRGRLLRRRRRRPRARGARRRRARGSTPTTNPVGRRLASAAQSTPSCSPRRARRRRRPRAAGDLGRAPATSSTASARRSGRSAGSAARRPLAKSTASPDVELRAHAADLADAGQPERRERGTPASPRVPSASVPAKGLAGSPAVPAEQHAARPRDGCAACRACRRSRGFAASSASVASGPADSSICRKLAASTLRVSTSRRIPCRRARRSRCRAARRAAEGPRGRGRGAPRRDPRRPNGPRRHARATGRRQASVVCTRLDPPHARSLVFPSSWATKPVSVALP